MKLSRKDPLGHFEQKLADQMYSEFSMQDLKILFQTRRRIIKKYLDKLETVGKIKGSFNGKETVYYYNSGKRG